MPFWINFFQVQIQLDALNHYSQSRWKPLKNWINKSLKTLITIFSLFTYKFYVVLFYDGIDIMEAELWSDYKNSYDRPKTKKNIHRIKVSNSGFSTAHVQINTQKYFLPIGSAHNSAHTLFCEKVMDSFHSARAWLDIRARLFAAFFCVSSRAVSRSDWPKQIRKSENVWQWSRMKEWRSIYIQVAVGLNDFITVNHSFTCENVFTYLVSLVSWVDRVILLAYLSKSNCHWKLLCKHMNITLMSRDYIYMHKKFKFFWCKYIILYIRIIATK